MTANKKLVFLFCIGAALINFFIFGFPHRRTWGDAAEYNAYATNILEKHTYSISGDGFNNAREPGYPITLAAIYSLFGTKKFLAVGIIQALMLGLLGYFIYLIFMSIGERATGATAALVVSAFPPYGYYANELLTELLFTFLLGAIFLIAVGIYNKENDAQWSLFFLVGLIAGSATLVRVQLIFFLPFLLLGLYVIGPRPKNFLSKSVIALWVMTLLIVSWAFVVHKKTGTYAITEGRVALVMYLRADRAKLSYREITRYATDWIKRSIHGGQGTPFLDSHEYHKLYDNYGNTVKNPGDASALEKQNLKELFKNFGHYLYGNAVELTKLLYIEHDYTDYINRYVRAAIYVFTYAFFVFGLYALVRTQGHREIKMLSFLSLLFIVYNWIVITPFDAIPRYNTPYLFFYLVVGFLGMALLRQKRQETLPAAEKL